MPRMTEAFITNMWPGPAKPESCHGNSIATAQSVDVFEKLLDEVSNQSIFKQKTNERRCPKLIMLIESTSMPDHAKPGDRTIYMTTNIPGHTYDGSSFTHEANRIHYRPGLKEGQKHKLYQSTSGKSYFLSEQLVKDGVLTYEYTAKVVSRVIIASNYSKIEFDAKSKTISYFFSGYGVQDVVCNFLKTR